MKSFLKILIFNIVILSFYALYSNVGIPQIKPEAPPKEEKLELGAMTMEQFIALGDKVYNGKGTCELCHNPVGGRAPVLATIANIAADRIKDPRYKGKATNAEEYIHESMVEPSAFVVTGFGVTGTNDTQSPMPDVSKGAIGLSEAEIAAVIAYLQQKAGAEVTVQIPTEAAPAEEAAAVQAPAKTPEEVIAKYGCGACHIIAKEQGALGPDLSKIGASKNEAYLRQAILDPDAVIAKNCPGAPCAPGMMPPDYGDKMIASELEMLVKFMLKSK